MPQLINDDSSVLIDPGFREFTCAASATIWKRFSVVSLRSAGLCSVRESERGLASVQLLRLSSAITETNNHNISTTCSATRVIAISRYATVIVRRIRADRFSHSNAPTMAFSSDCPSAPFDSGCDGGYSHMSMRRTLSASSESG